MLSAINWNACPQSIGIAVRDRWNAAPLTRGHLSELGIVAETGLLGLAELAAIVRDEKPSRCWVMESESGEPLFPPNANRKCAFCEATEHE
jgi:hypothetical protein